MSVQYGARMGTTFAALLICGDRAQTFNLGDSRIYHVTDGEIVQLTKDHTEAERLVRLGILSPEEASKSASKNMLYKFLAYLLKKELLRQTYRKAFCKKRRCISSLHRRSYEHG